ncbi:MAG TPA: hypothetical protein VEZ14_09275 [Dehalococcoidia bacterium]|nr:hypothetical protein [Dehalococcoidia bacterium]
MEKQAPPADTPPSRKPARIAELEARIDERDETIRLLNEALSRALDELNALPDAA